ncbi:MAG: SsrA-binding protein SmpB [Actinobacteria bacterium]|nr:MAG: SsrA-binding protein SmpB [Actinomycetota bacterium]
MTNAGKVVATNRKAYHDYSIEETYEAGISLQGTEVKSLRAGKANLRDSFARVRDDELYLYNVHISPYSHGNIANHEPTRTRKLLLHKDEIKRLTGKVQEKGLTLVPLRIYFKGNVAKVELGLARGKAKYDKRAAIAERDREREVERALRERQK